MAVFIPEWVKVAGRHVHIKRVLSALDDEHVVRRPLKVESSAADFFVQHTRKGWLALAVDETPFAELDSLQLFQSEVRLRFEDRLSQMRRLGATSDQSTHPIGSLILMWMCDGDEVRALTREYLARFGVRLVSREQFMQIGSKLINGLLTMVSDEVNESLLGTHFPEAEIPAMCTTRRFVRRDNRATLGRFFLDHEQEWAAKLDIEPPAEQTDIARDFSVRLVNGVAGSGKTLIALSRAQLLANMFPDQRVLVLIHNTPVVADIKERMQRAYDGLPANLELNTFFGWTYQQWRRVFCSAPHMPDGPRVVPETVARHRAAWPELKLSDEQLVEEIDFINEALIVDETGYLEASRTGRGFALRPRERSIVWALHERMGEALRRSGVRMWSSLPRDICLADERQRARLLSYRHVLVDEAQFFAPSWFQLIKLAMQEDGQLFLCADPNQGFMRGRLSWKSVGLDVAGRTKKLRKSYRTTRAILQAANSVLAACGRRDADDYLEPDFDGMDEGETPVLIYSDSRQDAVDRLVNELAEIGRSELPLSALMVIYGDRIDKSALHQRLLRHVGEQSVWWLNHHEQKKAPPHGHGKDYLRMAYVESATGLEASVVFLVGVEDLFIQRDVADGSEAETIARKLYMAMTRAGQQLVLIASQRLTPDMERLFQICDDSRTDCGRKLEQ